MIYDSIMILLAVLLVYLWIRGKWREAQAKHRWYQGRIEL